jgi:hypothetical protein
VGIVGPADAIDRAVALLAQIQQPIDQKETVDCVLHPSFPGMNSGEPFQVELITQTIWHRTLRAIDVRLVEEEEDFTRRVGLLKKFVAEEVRALAALDSAPDVVICAMSQKLEEMCRTGIAEYDRERAEVADMLVGDVEESGDDTSRSFRRGLKAECMDVLPTQLIWHKTLAGTRGVQDLATRAWNLTTALMYKAKIIPWRLADIVRVRASRDCPSITWMKRGLPFSVRASHRLSQTGEKGLFSEARLSNGMSARTARKRHTLQVLKHRPFSRGC